MLPQTYWFARMTFSNPRDLPEKIGLVSYNPEPTLQFSSYCLFISLFTYAQCLVKPGCLPKPGDLPKTNKTIILPVLLRVVLQAHLLVLKVNRPGWPNGKIFFTGIAIDIQARNPRNHFCNFLIFISFWTYPKLLFDTLIFISTCH